MLCKFQGNGASHQYTLAKQPSAKNGWEGAGFQMLLFLLPQKCIALRSVQCCLPESLTGHRRQDTPQTGLQPALLGHLTIILPLDLAIWLDWGSLELLGVGHLEPQGGMTLAA